MTWGKVDPEKLPDSVTCYTDSTIALPLLTAYALARHEPRPLRRLYDAARPGLRDAPRGLRGSPGRGAAHPAETRTTTVLIGPDGVPDRTEDRCHVTEPIRPPAS